MSSLVATVRQAELTDINQIIRINKICLPENYSFDFFYRILSEYGFACVVGEIEGIIIGYVLTRVEKPLSTFLGLQKSKGHIISIAVLPQNRRLRIANKMMRYAMDKLTEREIETVYLEVRESNEPAIELYKQLGYEIKKEIKSYYRDGESAIVMEWIKKNTPIE